MDGIISLVTVFELTDLGTVPVAYTAEVTDNASDAVDIPLSAVGTTVPKAAGAAMAVIANGELRGDSQLSSLSLLPCLPDKAEDTLRRRFLFPHKSVQDGPRFNESVETTLFDNPIHEADGSIRPEVNAVGIIALIVIHIPFDYTGRFGIFPEVYLGKPPGGRFGGGFLQGHMHIMFLSIILGLQVHKRDYPQP